MQSYLEQELYGPPLRWLHHKRHPPPETMIDYSFNKIVIKYSAISTGNDLNKFKMLDTGMHLTGFYSEEKRMF